VNPVIWGIIAAAAAATVWHAVTEHHAHRRLLQFFRPGTVVPETSHDTWWHSLPKGHRVTVQVALVTAGLVAGIAYETVPAAAIAGLSGLVAAGIVLLSVRTVGATLRRARADAGVMPADSSRELTCLPVGRTGGVKSDG
jgi:hypothetical protein